MTPSDKLESYRGKRRAGQTPEPAGDAPAPAPDGAPRFVVQEHHARRLHWDLRLEHDGVLASWAVPKGIPERPEVNHLAVRTEDHPMEYLEFHGDIPAGQYGAGTMKIWDTGTFELEKWRKDEVMVVFAGERLQGRYVLFRTRGQDWMLHRMDPPADPDTEPLPAHVVPMLSKVGELPPGDGWAYEVKWDGVRALGYVEGGRLRLESRNGRDITSQYPELRGVAEALGSRPALLDGEIVAFDPDGRPSFERLQGRMHVASEAAVRRKQAEAPVTYLLFDVLHLDGRSLLDTPWEERRAALEALELEGRSWRTPAVHRGDGADFAAATAAQGLEGIVAKRVASPYEPGRRSGAWVKVKHVARQELVVGGWMPGEGRRRDSIGALLLGVHDEDGALRYAGRVGSGFTETELRRLSRLLGPLERADSPFEAGAKPPKGAVWTEPELVVEVGFTEWTSAGVIRHPVYKGLRDDVDPARVVREGREPEAEPDADEVEPAPAAAPPAAGARGGRVRIEDRELNLSNLDKVLYPATGFAKAQVLDYYARIAPALLPHLAGRALTLKRYPDGVDGKFFYEKNAPGHRPDWVRTETIGGVGYTVIDGLPALAWVANLASLELHTSLAMATDPGRPTTIAFDLDPGAPADIVTCCEVGLMIREVLSGLGLESWAKTSGSKGLQVYAPLNVEGVTFAQTKSLSRAIAQLLERREPKLVVSRQNKDLRKGKVLVDWSQNDEHKTTVCVYSLRARERPTVSTPVTWDEVAECHDSGDPDLLVFEAGAVLERVAADGDRFAPVAELEQALPDVDRALAELAQGPRDDLGERQERLDDLAQRGERDAGADREVELAEPLPGLGPDRAGAGQHLAVGEEQQEAEVVTLVPRGAARQRAEVAASRPRVLADPDRGDGRIGVGDAGDRAVVGAHVLALDVGDDDARLVAADVGEGRDAGDVADRPDAVRGAAVFVHRHGAVLADLDPGPLEAEPVGARPPAGGEQDALGAHLLPAREREHVAVLVAIGGLGRRVETDVDAVVLERPADALRSLLRFLDQQPLGRLDERHARAEPRPGLGELAADGAATEDDQALGDVRRGRALAVGPHLVELVEPVDRGHGRLRARRHDDAPGLEVPVADPHRPRTRDLGDTPDDLDAGLLQALGVARVVEVVDHAVAPGEHRRGVDPVGHGLLGAGDLLRGLEHVGRAQERLRGHAAPERALAGDELALADRHRVALAGQRERGRLAAGAGPDHHRVEPVRHERGSGRSMRASR